MHLRTKIQNIAYICSNQNIKMLGDKIKWIFKKCYAKHSFLQQNIK